MGAACGSINDSVPNQRHGKRRREAYRTSLDRIVEEIAKEHAKEQQVRKTMKRNRLRLDPLPMREPQPKSNPESQS
jgi:hypothetical protein